LIYSKVINCKFSNILWGLAESVIFRFAARLFVFSKMPVQITAHRGASGSAPENTIIALQKAIEAGAEYAEIDVQETYDGKLVLLHDPDLKRTTGIKKNIWQTTYDKIKNLDAGSWFSEEFKGERIPLLEDAIEFIRGRMLLNIELKTNGNEVRLAERVCEIVKRMNFSDQVILTSFEPDQLRAAEITSPGIRTGLIFYFMPSYDILSMPYSVLSLHKRNAGKKFLDQAREAGKELHVWTVNEEKDMHDLIQTGVDNIITNYPERLRSILRPVR